MLEEEYNSQGMEGAGEVFYFMWLSLVTLCLGLDLWWSVGFLAHFSCVGHTLELMQNQINQSGALSV